MPVTLAQAKLNTTDDVDVHVINEFQKQGWLVGNLPFHDVVNGAGAGGTLTYGYTRQITQATAGFRAINAEYTPQEVTKQRFTTTSSRSAAPSRSTACSNASRPPRRPSSR
jgi:hypothetical protein